jgi:HK97 family phage portal protein
VNIAGLVKKAFGWTDPYIVRIFGAGGYTTDAGITIHEGNALEVVTVYACVDVIAKSVAKLPLNVYERTATGGKQVATNHDLYPKLHGRPNSRHTSFDFVNIVTGHLMTWGNAYVWLDYSDSDPRKAIRGLWPLNPASMEVEELEDRSLEYKYSTQRGQVVRFHEDHIMHLRWRCIDGVKGSSPIALGRNAIGWARAAQQYSSKWFAKGGKPSNIFKHPQKLSDAAAGRLKASLDEAIAEDRSVLLEEGLDYQAIGLPPNDSQFLETVGLQVEELARLFGVPCLLIGHADKATTYASAEQMFQVFDEVCISPILRCWEDALNNSVFGSIERGRYFCKFNQDAVLRANVESRMNYFRGMVEVGAMSPNEVREIVDMNRVEGGDVYRRPLNTAFVDDAGKVLYDTAPTDKPADKPTPQKAVEIKASPMEARLMLQMPELPKKTFKVLRDADGHMTHVEVTHGT